MSASAIYPPPEHAAQPQRGWQSLNKRHMEKQHQTEQVLQHFRERFVKEMDANGVVMELLHREIIPQGVRMTIYKTDSPRQQNEILHERLFSTCTYTALKTVCEVICNVVGNPKMTLLGQDMMMCLETDDAEFQEKTMEFQVEEVPHHVVPIQSKQLHIPPSSSYPETQEALRQPPEVTQPPVVPPRLSPSHVQPHTSHHVHTAAGEEEEPMDIEGSVHQPVEEVPHNVVPIQSRQLHIPLLPSRLSLEIEGSQVHSLRPLRMQRQVEDPIDQLPHEVLPHPVGGRRRIPLHIQPHPLCHEQTAAAQQTDSTASPSLFPSNSSHHSPEVTRVLVPHTHIKTERKQPKEETSLLKTARNWFKSLW